MPANPLGLSLYFFARHEEGFEPELHAPMLARHGITLVEFAPLAFSLLQDRDGIERTRAALHRAGVAVNSVHAPFGGDLDLSSPDPAVRANGLSHARQALEYLRALDGRCLVVHPSAEPIDDAHRADRMALCRESLQALVDELRPDDGTRLAVEILPRTCLGRDSTELLAVLEPFDPAQVGVCLDVNHANLRESLLDATRRLGARILTTHISDNDGIDERHWLPGKGVIPWRAWLDALVATGYQGPLLYELNWEKVATASVPMDAILAALQANAEEFLHTGLGG